MGGWLGWVVEKSEREVRGGACWRIEVCEPGRKWNGSEGRGEGVQVPSRSGGPGGWRKRKGCAAGRSNLMDGCQAPRVRACVHFQVPPSPLPVLFSTFRRVALRLYPPMYTLTNFWHADILKKTIFFHPEIWTSASSLETSETGFGKLSNTASTVSSPPSQLRLWFSPSSRMGD
jgi:hypothetical protein